MHNCKSYKLQKQAINKLLKFLWDSIVFQAESQGKIAGPQMEPSGIPLQWKPQRDFTVVPLEPQRNRSGNLLGFRRDPSGHAVVFRWDSTMIPAESSQYPVWLPVLTVYLVLTISSAECERAVPVLKLIKTAKRNRMGQDLLEQLMHLKLNGPTLAVLCQNEMTTTGRRSSSPATSTAP